MKKMKTIIMTLTLGIIFSIGMMAQPPRPPLDPIAGGNQSPGGNPPAGAPIAPGTGILLILAVAYGVKEFRRVRGYKGLR
jgi:hypothetical protein